MPYMDELAPENMPTTPEEVLTIMIEQLQDLRSDLEFRSTDEFRQLPHEDQAEVLYEANKLVGHVPQDIKKFMRLMTKLFKHEYYNEIDLMDRLRQCTEEAPE